MYIAGLQHLFHSQHPTSGYYFEWTDFPTGFRRSFELTLWKPPETSQERTPFRKVVPQTYLLFFRSSFVTGAFTTRFALSFTCTTISCSRSSNSSRSGGDGGCRECWWWCHFFCRLSRLTISMGGRTVSPLWKMKHETSNKHFHSKTAITENKTYLLSFFFREFFVCVFFVVSTVLCKAEKSVRPIPCCQLSQLRTIRLVRLCALQARSYCVEKQKLEKNNAETIPQSNAGILGCQMTLTTGGSPR